MSAMCIYCGTANACTRCIAHTETRWMPRDGTYEIVTIPLSPQKLIEKLQPAPRPWPQHHPTRMRKR